MRKVRVAILGVGRLGAFHAKVLSETKDVDELRVYDADAARAKDVAGALRARVVATIDEAIAGVDTAVIVTPTDTHAPLIKRCLDARIATFCEKPIAI
ncbi:MAG: Gfo/Idh/MocA family protein, partial [Candidatus Limnocylindria bacterium]